MDFAKLFENYELQESGLKAAGLVFDGREWKKTYSLNNVELQARIALKIGFPPEIQVYDSFDESPYTVYRSDSATGSFVGQVRLELEELLLTIREKHFV